MSTSETSLGRNSGLSNVVDIIVAPNAAFERLRAAPTWLWAFVVVTVLGIIGSLLSAPATMHAIETSFPGQLAADPNFASLSPEQQQRQLAIMLRFMKTFASFGWILVPVLVLVGALVQGLVMMIANAASRGDGGFKKFFALSMTVAVVGNGLYWIVLGVVTRIRGADSFSDTAAVYEAVPSLALVVPGVHGFMAGFLAGFNVFYIWATVLLALGMIAVGRVSRGVAWGTAIFMLLCAAALVGSGTRQT